jgi:hypothetical protein
MEPGDRSPPPGRPEDPHLARAAGRGDDAATRRQGARGSDDLYRRAMREGEQGYAPAAGPRVNSDGGNSP